MATNSSGDDVEVMLESLTEQMQMAVSKGESTKARRINDRIFDIEKRRGGSAPIVGSGGRYA